LWRISLEGVDGWSLGTEAAAGGEDDQAAVGTVMAISAEHHEREERYVLPGCVLGLDMNQRKELGRQWCAFMAAWGRDGARPSGTPHQPV
jgi:hypothetical protein